MGVIAMLIIFFWSVPFVSVLFTCTQFRSNVVESDATFCWETSLDVASLIDDSFEFRFAALPRVPWEWGLGCFEPPFFFEGKFENAGSGVGSVSFPEPG
jgi:hypothetical protein